MKKGHLAEKEVENIAVKVCDTLYGHEDTFWKAAAMDFIRFELANCGLPPKDDMAKDDIWTAPKNDVSRKYWDAHMQLPEETRLLVRQSVGELFSRKRSAAVFDSAFDYCVFEM